MLAWLAAGVATTTKSTDESMWWPWPSSGALPRLLTSCRDRLMSCRERSRRVSRTSTLVASPLTSSCCAIRVPVAPAPNTTMCDISEGRRLEAPASLLFGVVCHRSLAL